METKGDRMRPMHFSGILAIRSGSDSERSRASSLPRRLQQQEGGQQGREGPQAASGDPGTSATSLLAPWGLSPTFFRKVPFCPLFPQPASHSSGVEE